MDISPHRLAVMRTAIELGVDEADFSFHSHVERPIWAELVEEFDAFAERNDLVWVDAA